MLAWVSKNREHFLLRALQNKTDRAMTTHNRLAASESLRCCCVWTSSRPHNSKKCFPDPGDHEVQHKLGEA
jgi:hypothetical protein